MVRVHRREDPRHRRTIPTTAEKLIPKDHRFGEKRPPFVTGYYETYNKPNVSLVDLKRDADRAGDRDAGSRRPTGVREFDIIVWATGFDFGTGALLRMGIRGRDGLALEDHWADGPKTFLGVQTTGFPNLFFPGGPHAAAGNNPRYNGDQVDFVTDTLVYARDHGYDTIEVDPAAEERVDRDGRPRRRRTPPFGESSYYFGTNIPGKPRKYLLNSGGRPKLFKEIAGSSTTDYKAFRLSRSSDVRRREGEPTTPGSRSGGAVSRNRLRPCSRSHAASSCRYHISPSGTPSLNRHRWWIGRNECRLGSRSLPSSPSTA